MSPTPGPWTFEEIDDDCGIPEHGERCRYIRDRDGNALMGGARYYPWTPKKRDDWVLIAAAPDLLAALKYLLELGGDDDRRIMAEAAIAKAEGR